MEKNGTPLTRDALVAMQVIDAHGRLVGKVKDVAFAIGKMGISLTVENDDGDTQHIDWEKVQAAADFILLKPEQTTQAAYQPQTQQQTPQTVVQPQSSQPLCPICNKPLTWIPQYQRWYCYTDKKYA